VENWKIVVIAFLVLVGLAALSLLSNFFVNSQYESMVDDRQDSTQHLEDMSECYPELQKACENSTVADLPSECQNSDAEYAEYEIYPENDTVFCRN
jgi:hypothetical protein